MTRHRWLWLPVVAALAAPLEGQAPPLRVDGQGGRLNSAPVIDRGHAAYPVTVLEALGARIERDGGRVAVLLFGDTLRFDTRSPFFRANRRLERLDHTPYRKGQELFLHERFFTEWLPERYYPDLVYEVGRLAATLTAPVAVRDRARPVTPAARSSVASPGRRTDGTAAQPQPPHPQRTERPEPPAEPKDGRVEDAEEEDDEADQSAANIQAGSLIGSIDGRLSSVYDSNIDHDEVPQRSYGSIARIDVGLVSSRSRPLLAGEYQLAIYRFTNTGRWNRVTHDVRVELSPPVSRTVRPTLAGEMRLGSSTEDRERADQYTIEPELEFRLSRAVRLTMYAAQRLRRFEEATEQNQTNRIGGAEIELRWSGGGRVFLEGRYEFNDAPRERSRYRRWMGESGLRIPVTRRDRLTLELRHRRQFYTERLVEVADEEVLRVDRRWTPAGSYAHRFSGGVWELRLDYEFDDNVSNEAGETYQAHRVEFMIRRVF